MSAWCNFQTCTSLKKVLNKVEDSYQTYINTCKTHTLATCHGGTGKPSEKDSDPQETDELGEAATGADLGGSSTMNTRQI